MNSIDLTGLIHPILAVALVYPLIGIVVKLAWETRQRRLEENTERGSSQIPRQAGPEHLKLGRWLTTAVVGITLIALVYSIYFKSFVAKDLWNKAPQQVILIVLVVVMTIASLVFLYQVRPPVWRGLFATLTGAGLVILGLQDGVYRRDNEWYVSHFYWGLLVSLLMVFSVAIIPDIYRDRSHRWRLIHTVLNCFAIFIFLIQGMTGSRDLLEIPLDWQKKYLWQCDFQNQVCPQLKSETIPVTSPLLVNQTKGELTVWETDNLSQELAQKATTLATGKFITITPGEDTSGSVEISQNGTQLGLKLRSDFLTKEGPDVTILLHQQERPSSYNEKNHILLSNLKSFQGEQFYQVPAGVKWENYPHVVIWCRRYNVTFASAKLQKLVTGV